MYKAIDVWKRKDGVIVRFRCFEVMPSRGYCVQSADFYSIPLDREQIPRLEKQFLELLLEEAPEVRGGLFPTIEEAIAAHERDFE